MTQIRAEMSNHARLMASLQEFNSQEEYQINIRVERLRLLSSHNPIPRGLYYGVPDISHEVFEVGVPNWSYRIRGITDRFAFSHGLGHAPFLGVRKHTPVYHKRFKYLLRWQQEELSDCGFVAEIKEPLGPASLSDDVSPRRISPQQICYSSVKSWLSRCQGYHQNTCYRPSSISPLPGFKLIDCITKSIVSASLEESYIALSYVWEQPSAGSTIHAPPNTVRDAIAFVQEIGLRFLWVDRYCIPQDNSPEQRTQIQRMDEIYANAEATIIAAAGRDSSYGLPGVGTRPRNVHKCERVEGRQFVSSLPSAKEALADARWMTRAWTFQEGLLSLRCIVFTDYQVYFECKCMQSQEWLEEPLILWKCAGRSPSPFTNQARKERLFPYRTHGLDDMEILRLITNYSKREISQCTDNLNAILGILSSFGKQKQPIHHVWGVPILPVRLFEPTPPFPRGSPRSVTNRFAWALTWTCPPGFRCCAQPSWSWTGWSLPSFVRFGQSEGTGKTISDFGPQFELDIAVEKADGAVVPLESYIGLCSSTAQPPLLAPFLHVRAWVVRLKFQSGGPGNGHCKLWAKTMGEEQARYPFYPTVDMGDGSTLDERLRSEVWEAMVINHDDDQRQETLKTLIVLEQKQDRYERIGMVYEVSCKDFFWRSRRNYNPYQAQKKLIRLG